MVKSLFENWDDAVNCIKDNLEYMGLTANDVSQGLIGENADDKFNVQNSKFIRLYVGEHEIDAPNNTPNLTRLGGLTALVGASATDQMTASKDAWELAEKLEKLYYTKSSFARTSTPKFIVKNDESICMVVVEFLFKFENHQAEVE